jgi:WD40 repeat protein
MSAAWKTPSTLAVFDGAAGQLATVTKDDPRLIRVWELASADDPARPPELHGGTALRGHVVDVYQLAFSQDRRRIASAGTGLRENKRVREIRVWDAATGACLFTRIFPTMMSTLDGGLALSPDGLRLAVDDYAAVNRLSPKDARQDGSATAALRTLVRVLEVDSGKDLCVLAGHASRVAALAFGKDGRFLASGDRDGGVFVWDTTTAAPLHAAPLQGPFPFQLRFSPDGSRLVALDREQAKLWDVDSGHEVLILRAAPLRGGDEGFNPQLAWSPDGRRLATLNWNRTLSVWDAGEAYSARKSK